MEYVASISYGKDNLAVLRYISRFKSGAIKTEYPKYIVVEIEEDEK